MAIKWKSGRLGKPAVALEGLSESITIDSKNRVSFIADSEHHERLAILETLLSFPKKLSFDSVQKQNAIRRAVAKASLAGDLTPSGVLKELNRVAKEENDKPEATYHLITSLSVDGSLPFRKYELDGCKLRFLTGHLPKKYRSREEVIKDFSGKFSDHPPDYIKCIVSTKAKSERSAAHKALRALDLFRGYCNLILNPAFQIVLGPTEVRPINVIRAGETHTLHYANGKAVRGQVWYEPNFKPKIPLHVKKPKILKQNVDHLREGSEKSKYSEPLDESLLRFVRSLDETDFNTGMIRLWSAIETLASPNGANYEAVVQRCSFLFDDYEYQGQVLNHLREYRNSNVHAGEESENAREYCYQSQRFYRQLFFFHIAHAETFSSLEQANSFLDLPPDAEKLFQLKDSVDRCIKFRKLDASQD